MKRTLTIPKIKLSGARIIQEGFCSDDTKDCRGVACKDCIFSNYNVDHFITFFQLDEIHGELNVIE